MKGKHILTEVKRLISDQTYSDYSEINRAYRDICKLAGWTFLKETSETLLVGVASQASYSLNLNNFRRFEAIWIKSSSGTQVFKEVFEVTPKIFENIKSGNTNADGTLIESSTPTHYKVMGGAVTSITFTPVPNESFTARIDYIKLTEEILAETTPSLPQAHHDTVAMLAAGYILELDKDPVRVRLGEKFVTRARSSFDRIVNDNQPNRTDNIDRTPRRWIK